MPIYDRSTKELMHDFAKEKLKPGQTFTKKDALAWFKQHYSKINPITVGMHVEGMSVNAGTRRHHKSIAPNKGWDLFLKLPNGQFRLWNEPTDPSPQYRSDYLNAPVSEDVHEIDEEDAEASSAASPEFAYEQHLQQYLVKNLSSIEPGLHVYEDEGLTGVEFPVGNRRIDILAVDAKGSIVVIELKVSRGYDRTIGQLLRYMGWIEKNLADGKKVRGIIVASDITEDLRLASSRIPDVILMEYEISFSLKPVGR